MDEIAIHVEGISKKYRIGERRGPYKTIRESLMRAWRLPYMWAKRIGSGRDSDADIIWAVKDVTFDVQRGEVIGIIGRNGAGKSTLLKILSRITDPTEGIAEIHGRVGSLLEVGTGFHPELTGRENIFLNGAILGMRRAEIKSKLDEIVAFAEVEKFVDTAVKHYSSGMYLRLAFAVAAHLELEILLVDEVLAVGDAAFQKKCLGKMQEVAGRGRTVIFVSHNMGTVQHLCPKAILMQDGRIESVGTSSEVIGHYLSHARSGSRIPLADWQDRLTTGEARILEIEMLNGAGHSTNLLAMGDRFSFVLHTEFYKPFKNPSFGLVIHNALGERILDLRSIHSGFEMGKVYGPLSIQGSVESLNLYPGRYLLSPWISDASCRQNVDFPLLCCTLDIEPVAGPHGELKLDAVWGKYWVMSDWKEIEPAISREASHL